jgi:hypothetical protein
MNSVWAFNAPKHGKSRTIQHLNQKKTVKTTVSNHPKGFSRCLLRRIWPIGTPPSLWRTLGKTATSSAFARNIYTKEWCSAFSFLLWPSPWSIVGILLST